MIWREKTRERRNAAQNTDENVRSAFPAFNEDDDNESRKKDLQVNGENNRFKSRFRKIHFESADEMLMEVSLNA